MKAKTAFTVILIAAILVPMVGAAYVLRNNGTITINHGALYVDGVTVDQYIISLVGVGGGNFDQSLNWRLTHIPRLHILSGVTAAHRPNGCSVTIQQQ